MVKLANVATVVGDFIIKAGGHVDASVVADAIHTIMGKNNTTKIKSVIDHVATSQITAVTKDLTQPDLNYLTAHHIVIA